MKKSDVSSAVDAAMSELGKTEADVGESAESTTVSESAKAGSDGVADETTSETTEAEQDIEAASDGEEKASDEPSANGSEESEPVVEAHSQDKGSSERGHKVDLVDKLLDELEARKGKREPVKEVAPRDISQVDLSDPKEVQNWIKETVQFGIKNAIEPLRNSLIERDKIQAIKDANAELTAFRNKYPSAEKKYGKAMAYNLKKYPDMPLEDAYKLASFDENRRAGKQDAYAGMDKKRAATLVQSTAKKPADTAKSVKSSREAVLRALEEHGA